MGGNNGRLVIAEEQIGKLEDMVIETRQNETHREKILKTQDFSELWDNVSNQIASLNKVKKKRKQIILKGRRTTVYRQ